MFKIYKYYLYTSLYHQIKDKEIRKYFYEFTKKRYQTWDNVTFNKLFNLVNKKYTDVDKTISNFFYISTPEIIILFLKDEYILHILEKYREENKEPDYHYIYSKLHIMYPNRF